MFYIGAKNSLELFWCKILTLFMRALHGVWVPVLLVSPRQTSRAGNQIVKAGDQRYAGLNSSGLAGR
ncbi:MAG: hypothetical protein CTY18_10915 [Methylomonas sp.]|nr:MAG: hypothetical protein CTY18_10915 [Methylomonas sp.]